MFIKIITSILGAVAAYLLSIITLPILKVKKQPIALAKDKPPAPPVRSNVSFLVDGIAVSAWLYLPKDTTTPVGCVVMNNGFCGTKDMILEQYALRFVEAGIAAISFDNRYFGESGGEPRQLYSLTKQFEDATAAVDYVRSRPEIDPDNIFVWGTSSSGNYGIGLAAEDQQIAGVIGQTPALDHKADGNTIIKRDGILWMLKILVHAQRDKGRSRLGLSPHRFPAQLVNLAQ